MRVFSCISVSVLLAAAVAFAQTSPTTPDSAPSIRVLFPVDGSTMQQPEVLIRVAVRSSPENPVTKVYAIVQGRLVALSRGLVPVVGSSGAQLAPGEQEITLRVPLPTADTIVLVRAETASANTGAAPLHLRWGGRSTPDFAVMPALYLLAIGVSRYQLPGYALTYPAKDAQDLADAFARQQGALYRKVEARVLTDEAATRNNIIDNLEWLQRQTTAKDLAVLILAGHGINDPATGAYYFLGHDADLSAIKRSMISQDDIQSTLRHIAGKALLFLDTCHSGNVLGHEQTRGLADPTAFVNELANADNGVIVFAAATGKQASRESPEWRNGAFTLAAVEGLRGRAAYLRDRPITVNMLDLYISERVKELTHGTQTPTTAKPSTVPDFPLAVPLVEAVAQAPPMQQPMQQPMQTPTLAPIASAPAEPAVDNSVPKRRWLRPLIGVTVAVAAASLVAGLIYVGVSQSNKNKMYPHPITVEF